MQYGNDPKCLECGQSFKASSWLAEFCGPKHRLNFGNRRRQRGAELYDAIVFEKFATKEEKESAARAASWRSKQPLAKPVELIAKWRAEDKKHRANRRSWSDLTRR